MAACPNQPHRHFTGGIQNPIKSHVADPGKRRKTAVPELRLYNFKLVSYPHQQNEGSMRYDPRAETTTKQAAKHKSHMSSLRIINWSRKLDAQRTHGETW